MKKFWAIFIINIVCRYCCFAQHNSIEGGTTIIAYIDGNRAYISADSKLLKVTQENKDSVASSRCKIVHVANISYGFSGNLIMYHNNIETFNAYTIMDNALSKSLNLEVSIPIFTKDLVGQLNKAILLNPKYNYDTTKPFLSIVFVTFKNSKPLIGFVNFTLNYSELHQREVEYKGSIMQNTKDTGKSICYIGFRDNIEKHLKENPRYFYTKKSIKYKLTKLIELEIEKNKQFVDKPIDILEIKETGCSWILQNQECK